MSDYNANRQNQPSGGISASAPEPDLDSTARFNRDELVRGWREYEARTPRVVPLLKYAAKTDMGQVRENNEDKFDFYEPESPALLAARGSLFAVGDGIGGALAGQIASEMMLKHLVAGYYDHAAPDLETALQAAIGAANNRIHSLAQMIPERSGMGTTLTAAIFVEGRVVVAQVGDSRAYLLRDGQIRQVTQDHSWVEEQVRAGLMTRAEAEGSPFRNVITRSMGAVPNVQPDFYVEEALVGDVWTLCSDGLTGHVEDSEIARIVSRHAPSEAARQLIELANARGGRDNVTVFVIAVRDLMPPAEFARTLGTVETASETSPGVTAAHPAAENGYEAAPYAASYDDTDARRNAIARDGYASPGRAPEPPRSGWRKIFGR